MGFSRRFAKNYAATGSRRRRRKRGPGNSATPLTNIVKLARSKRDSQQAKTHVDHLRRLERGCPTFWSLGLGYAGMKQPKRPAESKPGRVFQTGSSPTDSKGINLSYSYRALGGLGSTSQSSRVQDGGKSRHTEQGASNMHSAGLSRSLARTFTKCNWVEVASA